MTLLDRENETTSAGVATALAALRQFAGAPRPRERCELCSAALAGDHSHLIEVQSRQILCACPACALLFDGSRDNKYRRIPRDARRLDGFSMTEAQWESLLIPINLAFFFLASGEGRVVALYPSPAGAVESLLPIDAWTEIVAQNPDLGDLRPDVEALLVNRVGYARGLSAALYYVAPIDECFRLVGLIRTHWKGLSGGEAVWAEIGEFFTRLRCTAPAVQGDRHA